MNVAQVLRMLLKQYFTVHINVLKPMASTNCRPGQRSLVLMSWCLNKFCIEILMQVFLFLMYDDTFFWLTLYIGVTKTSCFYLQSFQSFWLIVEVNFQHNIHWGLAEVKTTTFCRPRQTQFCHQVALCTQWKDSKWCKAPTANTPLENTTQKQPQTTKRTLTHTFTRTHKSTDTMSTRSDNKAVLKLLKVFFPPQRDALCLAAGGTVRQRKLQLVVVSILQDWLSIWFKVNTEPVSPISNSIFD